MNSISVSILRVSLGSLLFLSGCSRDGNNPLLPTPDPSVTGVVLSAVGGNGTDRSEIKVTLMVETNLAAPITGLVLGNFAIREGLESGSASPTEIGENLFALSMSAGAKPTSVGIPSRLIPDPVVPGQYELTFQPRSLHGFAYDSGGVTYQVAWIYVAYGSLAATTVIGFATR